MARFRPSYGIATDVATEAKNPTLKGWADYLWGGFEEEDLNVSGSGSKVYINDKWEIVSADTPGGRWVDHDVWARHEGMPTIAEKMIEQRNKERAADDSFLGKLVGSVAPEPDTDVGPKNVPWKKLAVVTVGLGVVYLAVIRFLPMRKAT
jgi:hypothetical protein